MPPGLEGDSTGDAFLNMQRAIENAREPKLFTRSEASSRATSVSTTRGGNTTPRISGEDPRSRPMTPRTLAGTPSQSAELAMAMASNTKLSSQLAELERLV